MSIGVAHRAWIFWRFRADIQHLLAQHAGDLGLLQLYPLEVYRQHFWTALWLLQQTPPLPHIVVKLALKVAAWPVEFTAAMFVLQAGISIATSCALADIVTRVTRSAWAGFGLALWFLLSTDLLILENDFFGQGFYENLGMLLVALCCRAFLRGATARWGSALAAGVFAALAALTRSSLSYFMLAPLLAGGLRWRRGALAAYLAPVLLLQGGWALKNAAVYGHFAWETSSWGGYGAATGLGMDGQGQALCDFIKAAPGDYPAWFVASVRDCPWPLGNIAEAARLPEVAAADAADRAALGWDIFTNSRAASITSAQYKRAVLRYALAHPAAFARRVADLYPLFWERIGNFGVLFVDPFVIDRPRQHFPGLWTRGFGETQRIELATPPGLGPPSAARPAWFGTVSLAPLDAACIVAVHLLLPLLLALDFWRRRRGRGGLLPAGSGVLAWTVGYGLVLFNIADAGENMRFRLAIEPEIIAVLACCWVGVAKGIREGFFFEKKNQKTFARAVAERRASGGM